MYVFSRDALLERVRDDPGKSFNRTVDAHVKALRAKMKQVAPLLDPIARTAGPGMRWRRIFRQHCPGKAHANLRA